MQPKEIFLLSVFQSSACLNPDSAANATPRKTGILLGKQDSVAFVGMFLQIVQCLQYWNSKAPPSQCWRTADAKQIQPTGI
jgi:hypothetical protein